jgi:hypothetical protein
MKITKIRVVNKHILGSKIKSHGELRKPLAIELELVCDEIENHMRSLGFKCEANIVNSTALKVDWNKSQFRIDTDKLGYNTQCRPGHLRRTNLPSWDQRVEFNDALNAILTRFGFSANVKSGPFTIREGFEIFTESDWTDQKPDYIYQNEANGYVVTRGDYKANTLKLPKEASNLRGYAS